MLLLSEIFHEEIVYYVIANSKLTKVKLEQHILKTASRETTNLGLATRSSQKHSADLPLIAALGMADFSATSL